MTRKERRKSTVLCLAAILTCCLVQKINCNRLKKTQRGGRRESSAATRTALQEGKIVFGKVFVKGASTQSPQASDKTMKFSMDPLVQEEAAYQADSTGWSNTPTHVTQSTEAAWKRMSPSLQCGGDQLRFKVLGPGVSQLSVLQGAASPVPLSQVPSNCGYNMHRNSLALVLQVPYDGCNVVQEGGSYVLPLQWQGIPISLWCSKPATPACTTTAPATSEPQKPAPPSTPTNPPVPQKNQEQSQPKLPPHIFFPPQFPQYPKITPEPTTQTAATAEPAATTEELANPKKTVHPMLQMPLGFPPWLAPFPTPPPLYYHYFTTPAPATTASTTPAPTTATATPAATAYPQKFYFPNYHLNPYIVPGPMQFPWFHPPAGKTESAQTTAAQPATTTMSKSVPYWFQFPVHPPQYPQFPVPVTTPAPATTTISPAEKGPDAVQFPYQSYFHRPNYPFQFLPYVPNKSFSP